MLGEDGVPGRDEVLAQTRERCHRFVPIELRVSEKGMER